MKKYLFFLFFGFSACTKTTFVREASDENGIGWPSYIVKHPIDSITSSLVGEFAFDAKMYATIGQCIDGNHGQDTVYLVTCEVPLSPAQTRENLRKRGFTPAGVGYLLGMIREYASVFKRQYRFPASIEPGNLVTWYGGVPTPLKTVLLYTNVNAPPLLWCLVSNAAPDIQTEYACFKKR